MPTPSRNDIYEAVIRKMVTQALEEQETIFEQNHGQDTDEGLILYLRGCAQDLGYSPRYKEVIGWRLLEQRFGGWNAALQQAGISSPSDIYEISFDLSVYDADGNYLLEMSPCCAAE